MRIFIEGQHWHWHTGEKVLLSPAGYQLRRELGLADDAGVDQIATALGGWITVERNNKDAAKAEQVAAEKAAYKRGYDAAYAAAVLKERERFCAIVGLAEARGRQQEAIKLALTIPDLSPELAKVALAAMPAALPQQKRPWGGPRTCESKMGLVLAGEGDK